ncbi:MAG: hypothetical protein HYT39_00400 [Candidatus Sungbacteria bacterium]|nr:hypothetical protein [Candidatus Sungbacteria bacterium]
MPEKKQRTLLDVVVESGDHAACVLITGRDTEQQLANLDLMFAMAIDRHDDPGAQKFASWILFAVRDNAMLTTNAVRFRKAIALLNKLPTFTKSDSRVAFLETKKMLLAEVANRWRDTMDESEADEIFRFLVNFRGTHGGGKMFDDLIREATKKFPAGRLARQLAAGHIQPWSASDNDLFRILAIAWIRNSDPAILSLQVSVVGALTGCSREVMKPVREMMAWIGKFDRDVASLRVVLGHQQDNPFVILPDGYEQIPGWLTITYCSLDVVETHLSIVIPRSNNKYEESEGYGWFEAAKRNIQRWQADHPHSVRLKMTIDRATGSGDKKLFSREELLTVRP